MIDPRGYAPMLARAEAGDLLALRGWHMEPKLDGDRAIAVRRGGEVAVLTRTGRDVTALVPALAEALRAFPQDVALDGEVGVVGGWVRFKGRNVPVMDFAATRSAMGSSRPVRATAFFAFDCLEVGGRNLRPLPEGIRRAFASAACAGMRDLGHGEAVRDLPRWGRWTPAEIQALIALGAEGAVLKNPSAPYSPGRRPARAWVKVKRTDTLDAVIVGLEPGKGRLAGTIGAIRFRYGGKVGTASGMDDRTRDDMAAHPEDWIGRVVEIAHTGSVGEGLRHPRFVRARDDKRAEECV